MQARQLVKLPRIGYNMLLLKVLVYVIIAVVVMRYIMKQSWMDVILTGAIVYALWFFTVIALCI